MFVCVTLLLGQSAPPPRLDPAKTHVVIAGVLKWPTKSFAPFSPKNRKDQELADTFRRRGVPAENIALLLDEKATFAGVRDAVRDQAGRAPRDGTLVFYYCGHGYLGPKGGAVLANYDSGSGRELAGMAVAAWVREAFRGKRVLLLADCCNSGGLAKAAEALRGAGYEAASLTSANAASGSTGNWTFTQTVIDALAGPDDSFADANTDGRVTLSELAAEVKGAMNALERQPYGFAVFGLDPELTLADRPKQPRPAGDAPRPGEYVLATDNGRLRAGRVVRAAAGTRTVQFYDYTEKRRVDVPTDKTAALPGWWLTRLDAIPALTADGKVVIEKPEIEVKWDNQWWPARVLERKGGKTKVHYIGWGDEWDEWVTADRLRPLKK